MSLKKLRMPIVALITCLMVLSTFASNYAVEISEDNHRDIVESITLYSKNIETLNSSNSTVFKGGELTLKLNYDPATKRNINAGDSLNIRLSGPASQYLLVDENPNTVLKGNEKSTGNEYEIADLGDLNRKGIGLTFRDMEDRSFEATLIRKVEINTQAVDEYFKNNPNANEIRARIDVLIDDNVYKSNTLVFYKNTYSELKVFDKTNGLYSGEGDYGRGSMYFNLNLNSQLRQSNEMVIYDTPDINLASKSELLLNIYDKPTNDVNKQGVDILELNKNTPVVTKENGMIAKGYDIYFLTEEPANSNMPRMASYQEKKITLDTTDKNGKGIESKGTVAVPNNIILEVPIGQKLTAEQEKLIEEKGGLNKKVGKGFKIVIKNFQDRAFPDGGSLIVKYYLNIVNSSPSFDKNDFPMYYNNASYYGQEIPDCDEEDEYCEDINYEKSDFNSSTNRPTDRAGIIKPSSDTATVGSNFTKLDVTKVEKDSAGNLMKNRPIKGAKFNIYRLKSGEKTIAINSDGKKLENLVTNRDGKLCYENTDEAITILLPRGNYIIDEIYAPASFVVSERETSVSLNFQTENVFIGNSGVSSEDDKPSRGDSEDDHNSEEPKADEDKEEPKADEKAEEPRDEENSGVDVNKSDDKRSEEIRKKPVSPNTGDSSNLVIWISTASILFLVTVCMKILGLNLKNK